MASAIDLAIAVAMFIFFLSFVIIFVINYRTNITGVITTSELRTASLNLFNSLFSGKGIPSNWENFTDVPAKIGLITDLYRIPVNITLHNGTAKYLTVNVTLVFDSGCENRAWNNTIRVYTDNQTEINSTVYNQVICSSNYIRNGSISIRYNFTANQSKIFYVYFSGDKFIAAPNYTVTAGNDTVFSIQVFPLERLQAISYGKLRALRNLNYDEVLQTISRDYKFHLEIRK